MLSLLLVAISELRTERLDKGPMRLTAGKPLSLPTRLPAVNGAASTATSAPEVRTTTSLREFLAFRFGDEEYGIDILRVQKIRSYEEPTRIANAPSLIKGVVNLRGVIVPIVDMRLKKRARYESC